jgi:hypothetical protein
MCCWRGMQVLLFTNKDEVPPLFRALAANLGPSSGAVFGAVHEREADVMKQFKVPKVWPDSRWSLAPAVGSEIHALTPLMTQRKYVYSHCESSTDARHANCAMASSFSNVLCFSSTQNMCTGRWPAKVPTCQELEMCKAHANRGASCRCPT